MAVIGTGLIGTSVALAARRAGVTVFLSDRDPGAARIAEALDAGVAQEPPVEVDLAVLAVPPSAVAPVLRQAQLRRLASSYTDVASVKGEPERAALSLSPDPSAYIGGHPMAGRERSGPLAARADLFAGRPWVLTPSARTSRAAAERAWSLVGLCGAVPVLLESREHDEAVALASHVPHLVASLMAARLGAGPDIVRELAGRGVRDVTRIAAGDPGLWSDIIQANARAVAPVLRDLRADLSRLVEAVEALADPVRAGSATARRTVVEMLEEGAAGVSRTWCRPGGAARLSVPVRPGPGELARLFAKLADLGVGLDRATAETTAGGGVVLHVDCGDGTADQVAAGLRSAGWITEIPGSTEDSLAGADVTTM